MRQARPMVLRERYFLGLEEEIRRLLNDLIYKPLARALDRPLAEISNASGALEAAIRRGEVWYEDGQFRGAFSAAITRDMKALGAKFNWTARTWSLPRDALPGGVRVALLQAEARATDLQRSVLQTLDDIRIASIDGHSAINRKYAQTITWMEGDFQKAVAGIAIPPKLTDDQRHILARDWGENLDKYIKDWAAENIIALRQQVQETGPRGMRAETLATIVRDNYGVSTRKAKFLARQETALLMSKFQETRYRGLGITRYRWSGALDRRERPDHRRLQGKVFSWDDPPITDLRTGARNNAGEDYNCRCICVPLLDSAS